ncbi:putative tetratricopeptide-like helical domain superfamily [Helianthus annuus]|nr:putative tetratricopeptide-like helical domain superfamily [Helianthus annuus]KAJ0635175.1 putative tetratricopeptide-like helical domain superfamily [Helianthus annuus]KAJ0824924.1 putative tetratricopeptide-like helical domain superfamily [Helianthus annuus]
MRKQIMVSIAPLVSTFTHKFVRNASTTSSFFPSQFDSYFEPNPRDRIYTYNRDIETLMKSGSVDHALQLFDEMPMRDIITYNIVLSGLKRNGLSKEALYVYNQMVSQGFIESSSTFSTVLGVFSQEGLYQEGFQVHNRVVVLGLSLNVYVGSALIDLYMNMGLVELALRLFNDLPERNLATWNQLLKGFGEFGMSQKLQLYYRMKREGVAPNPLTFCYLLRSFGNERVVDQGRELHSYTIKVGWAESDVFVSNALVDFYSACGSITDAEKSFEVIPTNDVISWNSLVSLYASNEIASDALRIFSMMQVSGKKPSIRSFVGLLNLSSRNVNIIIGKQIHCFVLKLGFDHGSCYVCSALIDMYGKCGEIESSVSSVPRKTIEVCNSLMTSFAHCGIVEDVIELFGLMVDEDIGFDEVSLSTTVNTLSRSTYAGLTSCKLLHLCAVKSGFAHDLAVSCSLIESYSRFGDVKSSRQIFNQLSSPNVMCFTSIISAYSRNKMGTECYKLLEVMINKGLKPDKVTFLCVLTACNHSGMVHEGKMVFESMSTVHGVDPESQHVACMVDLLGHKGLLEEAEWLLKQTQFNNDSAIWSSLLRHCRAHHNETVGKRIAETVIKLEPENASSWLQVSNFYSEIRDFETAKLIKDIALARRMQRDMFTPLRFK